MKTAIITGVVALAAADISCDELTYNEEFNCELQTEIVPVTTHKGLTINSYKFTRADGKMDSTAHPLIALHGGPGADHSYLTPMRQLACTGRPVILYDQAGTGATVDIDTEEHSYLFEVPYYAAEVDDVTRAHKLTGFHLLGHSWGGIVTQEYVLHHKPCPKAAKLHSVIHASIFLNSETYSAGQQLLLDTFPKKTQNIVRQAVADGTWSEDPDFAVVNDQLTGHHTCRTLPMPDCVQAAFGNLNQEVYVAMQGPCEFTLEGKLKDWRKRDLMQKTEVPTLVTAGQYDTMWSNVMDEWRNALAKQHAQGTAEVFIVPGAAHMTMIDNNDAFLHGIQHFVKAFDAKPATLLRAPHETEAEQIRM